MEQQRLHYVVIPQLDHFVVFFDLGWNLKVEYVMFPLAFAFEFLSWTKYRIPEMKNIALKKNIYIYQKDFFLVMEKDFGVSDTKKENIRHHLMTYVKNKGPV